MQFFLIFFDSFVGIARVNISIKQKKRTTSSSPYVPSNIH